MSTSKSNSVTLPEYYFDSSQNSAQLVGCSVIRSLRYAKPVLP